MVTHICPICHQSHQVRAVRAALAYGRQITCSPECESERRKRMRNQLAEEPESPILHTWVVAKTSADFVRANGLLHAARDSRR